MSRGKNIAEYMERSGVDSLLNVVSNTLYGFNHKQHLPTIPLNKDYNQYRFFTRPQFNLTTINLRNVRTMYKYLNNNKNSIHRFARTTLDPRLQYGLLDNKLYRQPPLTSTMTDMYNAFIPVFSSALKSLSGWPSIKIPTYTSEAGLRKEQWTMVDGIYETHDVFELNATFMNFITEPITTILELWLRYPALVFEGSLYPYIDFILENEFDYHTRIYEFITEDTGRFIKKSAATGASFPITEDTGKTFDYSRDIIFTDSNKDITTTFACMGATYNEDITLLEFNRTSAIFNPDVRAYLEGDKDHMDIIPRELLPHFDNRGYPIIDLETNELQWLINKNSKSYRKILDILIDNGETTRYKKIIT